ncbi:MAG: glycosyltransferase family 4 protein [Spirochaetota bacterium]
MDDLRILGVFPVSDVRTGGQKRYVELTRQLAERGHAVYHICRPGLGASLPGKGVGIIPDDLSGYLIPRWWRYRRWVRRGLPGVREALGEAPDLVLAFGENNFFAARAAADHFGVPLVMALRNNFLDELRTVGPVRRRLPFARGLEKWLAKCWYRRLEAAICSGSDSIVFQSEADRDAILGRHPAEGHRGRVIPNSFRVSWLPTRLAHANRSDSLCRGIFIGHLNDRKGVRFLLWALAELATGAAAPVDVGLTFDVVGFGTLEPWCRRFVEERGLSERVTFHGRVEEPLELLAQADLLIVPSLFDSFPNTVQEALYVGTPVIGSDTPGIVTMLEYEALIFPRRDARALAERLDTLLRDPGAYQEVRRLCGIRREVFDFDWAEPWVELFREVRTS